MRKLLMALMTVAALSVGIVWAEGRAGKAAEEAEDAAQCL
jgi:hypothetical protein